MPQYFEQTLKKIKGLITQYNVIEKLREVYFLMQIHTLKFAQEGIPCRCKFLYFPE